MTDAEGDAECSIGDVTISSGIPDTGGVKQIRRRNAMRADFTFHVPDTISILVRFCRVLRQGVAAQYHP